MNPRAFHLAIETSSRQGSLSLGREDQSPATVPIASTANTDQQRVGLVPAIDRLFRDYGAHPSQLGEVYLSIGPGSFTGLRSAVTVAKTLAQVLGVKLVAVPAVQVLACNVDGDAEGIKHLAVCLNHKRQTVYNCVFDWKPGGWIARQPPRLASVRDLLGDAPRPIGVLGDRIGPAFGGSPPEGVRWLDERLAVGRSASVWRLGRNAAVRGHFTDPLTLTPLYARVPEAQTLWDQRHPEPARPSISPVTSP